MTELWVPDRDGRKRDVILGYDDNVRNYQVWSNAPGPADHKCDVVAIIDRPHSPGVQRCGWTVCCISYSGHIFAHGDIGMPTV